jgi:nitrite reductase/ring-hydroxylating ferredoxin subunit
MKPVQVANSGDVREGQLHAVKAAGQSIVLTRVEGKLCAIENKCPHLGLPLARGKVVDGTVRCPWHGSRFDICTGKNLDWVNSLAGLPLPQWSRSLVALGKQPAPVRTFEASEQSGSVFVSIDS